MACNSKPFPGYGSLFSSILALLVGIVIGCAAMKSNADKCCAKLNTIVSCCGKCSCDKCECNKCSFK